MKIRYVVREILVKEVIIEVESNDDGQGYDMLNAVLNGDATGAVELVDECVEIDEEEVLP